MSSTSIRRDFCLHYNGGTTQVTADCNRTRTLAELLAETLFGSSGDNRAVLRDIETRYICSSSASSPSSDHSHIVPFSIPTQLAPRELYLRARGAEPSASDVSAWITASDAPTTASSGGRGRGRGRGAGAVASSSGSGRGRSRAARTRRVESASSSGHSSSPSGATSDGSSDGEDSDADSGDDRSSDDADEDHAAPAPSGRGGRGGRGGARGGRGRSAAAGSSGTAGAQKRTPTATPPPLVPSDVLLVDGVPQFPIKRKRGRPPKNPQAVLLLQQQQQAEAAAAAAAAAAAEQRRKKAAEKKAKAEQPPPPASLTTTPPSSPTNAASPTSLSGAERRRRRAQEAEESISGSQAQIQLEEEEQQRLRKAAEEAAAAAAAASLEQQRLLAYQRRLIFTYNNYVADQKAIAVAEDNSRLSHHGAPCEHHQQLQLTEILNSSQGGDLKGLEELVEEAVHDASTDAVASATRLSVEGCTPSLLLADPEAHLAMPHVSLYDENGLLASSAAARSRGDDDTSEPIPQSVVVPVVVGGCVRLVNPESKEKSHRWTVYVRGLHNGHPCHGIPRSEDGKGVETAAAADDAEGTDYLSQFVDHVTFILDRSFTPCVRNVYEAPFELTEMGWGEFVVSIHLHLKYPGHSPASRSMKRRLQTYFAGSGGRATLLPSTGPGRGASGLDPVTSMTVVNTNLGRGTQVNAASNADSNILVDSLVDVNFNSAARSLYYRGPSLPPYLLSCSSDDEYDPRYPPTQPNNALKSEMDEDASPSSELDESRSRFGSPLASNTNNSRSFDDIVSDSSGRESPAPDSGFSPTTMGDGSALSPPFVRRGPGRRPSAARLRAAAVAAASGSPTEADSAASGGGRRLVASYRIGHTDNVVVLSHLLRFSHRAKVPPAIPPNGDVRSPRRGVEQLGYIMVAEPVVTEWYDEVVIPLKGCQHGAAHASLAKTASQTGGVKVKDEGDPIKVKKEPQDSTDAPNNTNFMRHRHASLWAEADDQALIKAAARLERQLRMYLHHHLSATLSATTATAVAGDDNNSSGGGGGDPWHRAASSSPPPPPASQTSGMPGGVSLWPLILAHGNAAARDKEFTYSYLQSLLATAAAEGWLGCALQSASHAYRQRQQQSQAVRRVGTAAHTTCEFELDLTNAIIMDAYVHHSYHVAATELHDADSGASASAFYSLLLPNAASIGARVLTVKQSPEGGHASKDKQRQDGAPALFRLHPPQQHPPPGGRGGLAAGRQRWRHGGAAPPSAASSVNILESLLLPYQQQPVGQAVDVATLSTFREALVEEIHAMRVEVRRREIALTLRQL